MTPLAVVGLAAVKHKLEIAFLNSAPAVSAHEQLGAREDERLRRTPLAKGVGGNACASAADKKKTSW